MQVDVDRAREFAVAAHGVQKYGDQPYVVHLDAVVGLLKEFKFGEEAQVVGYLHDVVEDAGVTVETVRERFGDRVARCVGLVSDQPGANRAERKLKTNAKLAKVTGDEELALVVKAADRLANLRACVKDGEAGMLAKYRGEHAAFRAAAYRVGLCEALWGEIEKIIGDKR